MLALDAAGERAAFTHRQTVTNAWLGGLLSGNVDPKSYPSLEDLLGDGPEPEPDEEPEPGGEHVGAQLWVMFLNKKR